MVHGRISKQAAAFSENRHGSWSDACWVLREIRIYFFRWQSRSFSASCCNFHSPTELYSFLSALEFNAFKRTLAFFSAFVSSLIISVQVSVGWKYPIPQVHLPAICQLLAHHARQRREPPPHRSPSKCSALYFFRSWAVSVFPLKPMRACNVFFRLMWCHRCFVPFKMNCHSYYIIKFIKVYVSEAWQTPTKAFIKWAANHG